MGWMTIPNIFGSWHGFNLLTLNHREVALKEDSIFGGGCCVKACVVDSVGRLQQALQILWRSFRLKIQHILDIASFLKPF